MTALVTDGLRWWAVNTPESPAIVFDGHDTVSYRELDSWTDGAAHALAARGIGRGDRVGMIGANSLEWCVAAIGALKLGAVVVPYNNRFVAAELSYLVDNSDPALVLADDQHRARMAEALVGGSVPLGGLAEFTGLRGGEHRSVPRPDAAPDDVAVLVYTSGTTSRPKGVGFTHRGTAAFITEWAFMEPALRQGAGIIYVLSMSGAPGLLWHILHPLTRGMTIHYERGFEPRTTLSRLAGGTVAVMLGVPVLFEQMAALPEFADADLSALELVSVAGARVPLPTIRAWLAKGVTLRQAYGMTELGGNSTINPAGEALTRPESVGRDGMFTRHRIVRPDGGECDPEEPGEIIVRGPAVTAGYWRNPEATAEALRDGWFHSGDVGVRDRDGFIRVVDRMKDMIISGGFNVAPSEIESVIGDLDGVDEVCVIPADDAKFGETPAAIVATAGPISAETVVAACAARLAAFKVPRYVVFQREPLPRMASGKIARRELRARYADLAATHERVR
ncbi:MAG: fatty-acyl-CoA synthase [Pseudonocardiales bacterium]|nr:fatty-acyl-CoA synthase [Pseudonocardiales bacterium]